MSSRRSSFARRRATPRWRTRWIPWSEGEPNDASGGEDCVQLMVGTGTLSSFWSDENCYKPNEFFIVEFDA